MVKFSELLGGIAKDLVQMQVTSDLTSIEVFSHYKNEKLLKHLDVPRYTISDIKLNLKFAISDDVELEQTDTSVKYLEKEWKKILKAEALKNIAGLSDDDQKGIKVEFNKAMSLIVSPSLNIKTSLGGSSQTTITKSTNYVIDAYKKMPRKFKDKLPPLPSLKNKIKENLNLALDDRLPALKQVASAKIASERDLEVIVEKEALEKINDAQIHEISFTLTPDFIKFIPDEENKQE